MSTATPLKPIVLGDMKIHRVLEMQQPLFPARTFFPALSAELLDENRSWLQPTFIEPGTDKLILAIQSYVVETKHHKILVDSCVGNHKPRPGRPFWDQMKADTWERNLAATGIGIADIDFVMCTHLHVDHVGWNTRLVNGRWVPTFPNARYLFSERELAYWTERESKDATTCPWITDSVLPIVAALRADTVTSAHVLSDHVRCIPTPGHTIDHFSVHVGPTGADAVITGDMIHSPIQARYPELGMMSDYSSEQAGQSRRELFGRFAETSTLMCTAHFPQPSVGRIERWKDAFDIRAA
jgi:glyoxylase-like metal-dependent hydrolase (beta-lactamase superfamily II)